MEKQKLSIHKMSSSKTSFSEYYLGCWIYGKLTGTLVASIISGSRAANHSRDYSLITLKQKSPGHPGSNYGCQGFQAPCHKGRA